MSVRPAGSGSGQENLFKNEESDAPGQVIHPARGRLDAGRLDSGRCDHDVVDDLASPRAIFAHSDQEERPIELQKKPPGPASLVDVLQQVEKYF